MAKLRERIFGAVKGFFPGLGRIAGALFQPTTVQEIPVLVPANPQTDRALQTGGRTDIPSIQDVRDPNSPAAGTDVPVARTTIKAWSVKGILRSRTVWAGIILFIYTLVHQLWGVEADIQDIVHRVLEGDTWPVLLGDMAMILFRIKANTLTRG